jgi:tetraacyldisaccharide 4'-kinase
MNWQSLQRSRVLQIVLRPLALLYGLIVLVRVRAYAKGQLKSRRLRAAVVSVGNLTVGGVGKTPMVLWLAQKFLARGRRVAVLSRGYRGARGTSDEVELLRERLGGRAPVGVGADRFGVGSALEQSGAIDLFLLDDGFQHMQLARDVDILLMDASRSLTNERLLPAGSLREPVSAMSRADILVFTRAETQPGVTAALSHLSEYPVFAATTKLLGFRLLGNDNDASLRDARQIGEGPFFAFCGLGHPQQFFRDLEAWQVPVNGSKSFPDHHRYNGADAAAIECAAEGCGSRALITTEKDAKNLAGVAMTKFLVYIAIIDMEISQEEEFLALIEGKIVRRAGAPS